MIGYIVKVTVNLSRDPDCNAYSLTESKEFGIDRPVPQEIAKYVKGVRNRFVESYPSTQGKPRTDCLLPTDVEVIDLSVNEKLSVAA